MIELISRNMQESALADFTKKILNRLILESKGYSKPISITVHSALPTFMTDIVKATGEIEDFAAKVNPLIAANGGKLEFLSGPGYYNSQGVYNGSSRCSDGTYCTFWLAERTPYSKIHEAEHIGLSAGSI